MRSFLLALDIIAFGTSIVWYVASPGYEPFIAAVSTLGIMLGMIFLKKNKSDKVRSKYFKQKAGNNSKQYQAEGDININE